MSDPAPSTVIPAPAASPSQDAGDRPLEHGPRELPLKMTRGEWVLVFMLVVSVVINYVDRSNLSLAVPLIQPRFALSPLQIGSLLSAFFWTYALLQLSGIAGWLSDRFPVGWVLAIGYVVWSSATIATGLTSGFLSLFIARLLLGAGESVAYPCYSRVFAELPQQHRGRANAFIDAGTKLGPAMGAFVGGILLVHFGWRLLFLVLGVGGLFWLVPWFKVMPRSSKPREMATPNLALPSITQLLRVKCAWGSFLGHFCGNYFFYFLLAWLPNYLVQEEKMSIGAMSRLNSGIFLLIACATVATGWTSDRLIAAGLSPTRVRRTVVVGVLSVASSLLSLAFVPRNLAATIAVLAVACLGYGAYSSNHWAVSQTLAGPYMAGRWTSLQNGFGNLSGIVAPSVAGLVVQRSGSARLAFVITGAVALAGAFFWGFLVPRVEPVLWNAPEGASARREMHVQDA
jgi:MFS transporter, ACS family, D-galactonate transporter